MWVNKQDLINKPKIDDIQREIDSNEAEVFVLEDDIKNSTAKLKTDSKRWMKRMLPFVYGAEIITQFVAAAGIAR